MATADSPDVPGTQVCSTAPSTLSLSQRQQSAKGKEVAAEPPSAQPAEGRSESENSGPAGDDPPPHDDVGSGNASSSDHTETPHPRPTNPPLSTDSAGQDPPPSQPPAAVRSADSIPPAQERAENGNARKDKGSLESEQTGSQTFKGSSLPRKDASKSVSDGAHTSSSEVEQADSARARRSKGLFSKLLRALVPCVGPSPRGHSIDLDEKGKAPASSKTNDATTGLKEKQAAKEAEDLPPAPQEPPGTTPNGAQASTSDAEIPPPLQPIDIPQQPDDPNVLVPPTPTKTLPLEETEGVTSGAVQPPGSTGEGSIHNHSRRNSRDMGEETDGSSSFTEDDDLEEPPAEDYEDEEERLIMQGGAGIPMGPVSSLPCFLVRQLADFGMLGRCSKTPTSTNIPKACWSQMSRARS